MAFIKSKFAQISAGYGETAHKLYSYKDTTQTIAAITASAFFNNIIDILVVNDLVIITGSDGEAWYKVTSVTTNVTVALLEANDNASHYVVYAGQITTTGGAAAEDITVTGALATDLAFVQMENDGTNNTTILMAEGKADKITVTYSADPGADAIVNYQLLRAI